MVFWNEFGRHLIRVADTTDHGGKVLTGEDRMLVFGRPAARIGDMVWCPLCKGNYPIIEGYEKTQTHNRQLAYEGHHTACGAKLISSLGGTSSSLSASNVTAGVLTADASTSNEHVSRDSFAGESQNKADRSYGYVDAKDLYEEDKKTIITAYRAAIDEMIKEGVRFDGSGFFPALWNNFRADDFPPGSWTGGEYYRCNPQSTRVLQRLYPLKQELHLTWGFRLAHTSSHYWVEAVPLQFTGLHGYEVIVMDSLYGSVDFKTQPNAEYGAYNPGINPSDPSSYVYE